MGIDLTHHEVQACRAVARLVTVKTEGWAEAEHADAHWDAGEWSSSAWADNWQRADEEATKTVAERFGLEDHQLRHCIQEYDCELQYRWWKAAHLSYVIWGATDEGTEQEVTTVSSRRKAETLTADLNDNPLNHPDLHYWFETVDERPLKTDNYSDSPGDLV